jgi:hypothetical protein
MALDLTYPNIVPLFGAHNVPGRLESRAFLGWFLENYFRLEESEAQESVCDGPDDKGVDGIYVDANLERVVIFQTKLLQNPKKTLGDSVLKEFAGSLAQFASRERIEHVISTTTNKELAALLKDENVAARVEDDEYDVVGVFVTNANRDANADTYLATRPDITVFDRPDTQVSPAGL